MATRKEVENTILSYIERMIPGGATPAYWAKRFSEMDDKEWEDFMTKLERREEMLCIVAPNMEEKRLDVQRNLDLGKELGVNFFQRVWVRPNDGTRPYLTNKKYLVGPLTLRRQAQLSIKKISIPQDNKSVSNLTGQPTGSGKSKSSKISFPELGVLSALNLDKSIVELIKLRGGDAKAFNAMNQLISQTGSASLDPILKLGTEVKSTTTLRTFLTCMHFEVDL